AGEGRISSDVTFVSMTYIRAAQEKSGGSRIAARVESSSSTPPFLVHFFGSGLTDDRYVVARFKAHADGDIRPWPGEAPARARGGAG
ncbi:MAG: hypothetical protein OXC93_03710, partial [Rhodospirillaceae bacterium]|nr:hypothetical protein [Rhodospirillaceae bacterium]